MARKRKKKPYRKYWLPCFLSGVVFLAGGGIGLLMGATYLNVWPIVAFVLGGLAMVFTWSHCSMTGSGRRAIRLPTP